jgi:hypothetical protein
MKVKSEGAKTESGITSSSNEHILKRRHDVGLTRGLEPKLAVDVSKSCYPFVISIPVSWYASKEPSIDFSSACNPCAN